MAAAVKPKIDHWFELGLARSIMPRGLRAVVEPGLQWPESIIGYVRSVR
jgi:hypothetical protein